MEQKSHILITGFAETCIENGLYGVSRENINLISNINLNDIVYIYDKKNKKLNGPFFVKTDLYFDETEVWRITKKNKELYPYRISFNYDKNYYIEDSSILWELYWNKNENLLPISTSNKSVITLFPKDSKLLFEKIKSKNNLLKYVKPIIENPNVSPFDYLKNWTTNKIKKEFHEADLEYFILKNQEKFIEFLCKKCNIDIDENAILYNQVTLPVHNFTMDLFLVNDINDTSENLIIVELKQPKIDEETIKQLRLYKEYFREFKKITLIAIGSKFDDKDYKDTFQIKYEITKDKKVKLTSKNGEEVDL